jgi:hypothetical protein
VAADARTVPVSPRLASWTAAVVLAVTLPLYAVSLWLGWSRPHIEGVVDFTGLEMLWILSFVAFEVVGAVVVVKRPEHPVGWLFLGAGASPAVSAAAQEYGIRALLLGADLPGGELAAWLSAWTWAPGLGLVVVALVLFPTGRPPSSRWWPVVWLTVATISLVAVSNAVGLWRLRGAVLLRDPELDPEGLMAGLWSMRLTSIVFPLFLLSAVLAMVGLVVRYRGARGEERQQLKVLALVAAIGAVALVAGETVADSGLPGQVAEGLSTPGWFAVAAGAAILRYRLYDIDRVISRTVSYALLTAVLAGVYVTGVVGLGGLVRVTTGGGGGDVVVAASTLAVAALFGPLRRRVQTTVERRFNRARYDAQHTLEAFAHRLRGEVDLDELTTDLRTLVRGAVQPRGDFLWLAAPADAEERP